MAKVSAIVRADACGLGTLSRMFADYLGFHRTVSIARHKGGAWPEWYGQNNREANDGLTPELIGWACEGADVLLSFECWYGNFVPALAKQLGVKTALMPMHECCPSSGYGLEYTDLAICPTAQCLEEMTERTPGLANSRKVLLGVPFDVKNSRYRPREKAEVFLHVAGHIGQDGRNGTQETIDAWRFVQSQAKLVVRLQPGASAPIRDPGDERVRIVASNPENHWELYDEGDVLLLPHKWAGLCLPVMEAMAAGMPVAATRFWPFCDDGDRAGWLPLSLQAMSIPWERRNHWLLMRPTLAHYCSPLDIAAAVDRLYGQSIIAASDQARNYAERFSCENVGPQYRALFSSLVSEK